MELKCQDSATAMSKRYCILPCMMCSCVQCAHTFLAQTFRGKIFHFNFLIQVFIYLYLDACFCIKGILAFIFEHTMAEEILCYK